MGNNDPLVDSNRLASLQEYRKKLAPLLRHAWICAVLLAVTMARAGAAATDDLAAAFGRATIIVAADQDACYRFEVYLATSREQQIRGLMYVRNLPEWSGMLFVYTASDRHAMWMKNTYIPLDILFIRADGTISNIAANTEPLSLDTIASSEPVLYVLELNAGITKKLHIGTDSIVHVQGGAGIPD
jgi:uncharacterized protein